MTTLREDHEQQIAIATTKYDAERAKAELERIIQDRRLKLDELPGKTILKTHLVCDSFVLIMDTGHFFSVEADSNYGEAETIETCNLDIPLAWQLGVITDAEGDKYALLKSAWQAISKEARETDQIHRLIAEVGADKVREALGK